MTATLPAKQPRDSNVELLRILVMYFIIAHHEIVNSGVWDLWDYSTLSPQMIFTQIWGMWSKTGVNVFVLIPVAIFTVGTVVDLIGIRLFEKPLFAHFK